MDESQNPVPQSSTPRFKALSAIEISSIARELQPLVGAQLQDCLQTNSELGLALYHQRETLWLWFDMNPIRPILVRQTVKTPQGKKIQRPLSLFLKSRFVGRRLAYVTVNQAMGRVLVLGFHRASDEADQSPIELELRLFPHGQNAIARDGEKQVAELKPKDLSATQTSVRAVDERELSNRSWAEIEEAYFQTRRSSAGARGTASLASNLGVSEADRAQKEWARAVEKKTKALERMREELSLKTSGVHAKIGEWLKEHRTLDVPKEWLLLVNPDKSLSWNIEECFRLAKENLRKAEGTKARILKVEEELRELEKQGPRALQNQKDPGSKSGSKSDSQNLLSKADARGRRHKIGDDLEAYIGKSAADNLAILRRAQPFDYWLHLKDQPGSHAILRRARGRNVKDSEFEEAGRWVIEQSLGKRALDLKGERFDLLIVECRYVRPIKGDKLGRVNYSHDRVMSVRFS